MRILFHALHYGPDPGGAGPFNSQLGAWLVERGHEVTVISTPPHYPQWEVAEAYRGRGAVHEVIDGVDVHRVPLYVPSAEELGARTRILHETSFNVSSLRRLVPELFTRPGYDLVLSICPPLQTAVSGLSYARARRIPFVFFLHDLQVDQAVDLGMIRNPRAVRAMYAIERSILRRSSLVATHTPEMRRRVIAKGVDERDTVLLPTWADTDTITPAERDNDFRRELGVDLDTTLVLYAGGMGEKHGLDTVLEAAHELDDRTDIEFVLIGAGPKRAELEAAAARMQLHHLRFWPLQPLDRMPEILAAGDVHLVIQKGDAADLMMPAKLTSILAAGRASVGTAVPGTAVAEVLEGEGAGVVVAPDDPAALAAGIARLAADPDLRTRLGEGARSYAERVLSRDVVLGAFERRLLELLA